MSYRHLFLPVITFISALWPALPVCSAQAITERGACPARFNTFLDQFAKDGGFRDRHTDYPLIYQRPRQNKLETMRVGLASRVHYPGASFPSYEEQASMPLERRITATASGTYTVELTKEASYDRIFVFRQTHDCWRLVQVRNAVPL